MNIEPAAWGVDALPFERPVLSAMSCLHLRFDESVGGASHCVCRCYRHKSSPVSACIDVHMVISIDCHPRLFVKVEWFEMHLETERCETPPHLLILAVVDE
jgi:hypothetical protein